MCIDAYKYCYIKSKHRIRRDEPVNPDRQDPFGAAKDSLAGVPPDLQHLMCVRIKVADHEHLARLERHLGRHLRHACAHGEAREQP